MLERTAALIPAHNDAYTLPLCLRSTVDHFAEVVVLDDASTDPTAEVAARFARRHRHVRLLRHEGERQLGWIAARNRLLSATRADRLFWLDADDVLCDGATGRLRRIAGGPHAVVRLQLCELWGDLRHTTGRLRHYDRCHVFVNRALDRNFFWRGGSAARPTAVRPAVNGHGPLLFHLKGVRPDRRLVERHFTRAWLRAGAPGRLEDFAGLADMTDAEIHERAMRILLRSRQDPLRPLPPEAPPLPAVLREAWPRFLMVYRDGEPVDRIDRGEAP